VNQYLIITPNIKSFSNRSTFVSTHFVWSPVAGSCSYVTGMTITDPAKKKMFTEVLFQAFQAE
jgi:hypothetical protein